MEVPIRKITRINGDLSKAVFIRMDKGQYNNLGHLQNKLRDDGIRPNHDYVELKIKDRASEDFAVVYLPLDIYEIIEPKLFETSKIYSSQELYDYYKEQKEDKNQKGDDGKKDTYEGVGNNENGEEEENKNKDKKETIGIKGETETIQARDEDKLTFNTDQGENTILDSLRMGDIFAYKVVRNGKYYVIHTKVFNPKNIKKKEYVEYSIKEDEDLQTFECKLRAKKEEEKAPSKDSKDSKGKTIIGVGAVVGLLALAGGITYGLIKS